MKINIQILGRFSAMLLLLAATAGSVRAADLVAKSFDTGIQEFGGGWDAPKVYTWDETRDGQTNALSGSLQVDVDFSSNANSTLQANLNVASFATYDKVRLSVYLDPTNIPNGSGHFGNITVRVRPGWAWPGNVVDLGNITNTGWTHFEKALGAGLTSSSGLNIHWNSGGFNDTRTLWLDNLVFVEALAPPAPPTLAIKAVKPGLEIRTAGDPDYSRRNVATADLLGAALSWLTSTGAVTYAMTVNESVEADSSGYAANLMLVAGTDLTINTSPDWSQPSGIFLEAKQAANGTYDVDVRYKTDAPNSHGIRFTAPGLLIERTNTTLTSLVGTWSLTLSNDTVVLSGPGGISGSAVLPADALPFFGAGNNVWALFGAQPYTRNNRTLSLSRVQISGPSDFTGGVDQIFTTSDALDPNLRALQEGSGGVVLKPTNTTWRVSWGLPDTGMHLWSASTLSAANWTYTGLEPITQGTQRTVFTTNVTSTAGYFRLRNSGPTTPAYLLESFESTSPFPAASAPYFNFEPSATAGVTEGASSLYVSYASNSTWAWQTSTDYGAAAYDAWKTHKKIVFDLHRAAFTDGWNLEMAVAIDGTMGWNQSQVVNWAWLNAGSSTTETITWDYSAISGAAPATGTSWRLNLMLRGSSGDVNGRSGDVYIDNIRFE